MALTKIDLAEMLFEVVGFGKCEAREVVDSFFGEICLALSRGEPVKLLGFGKFELRDKLQRTGRNPQTGEKMIIPPRRVVTFHPSKTLKTRVRTYNAPQHDTHL